MRFSESLAIREKQSPVASAPEIRLHVNLSYVSVSLRVCEHAFEPRLDEEHKVTDNGTSVHSNTHNRIQSRKQD